MPKTTDSKNKKKSGKSSKLKRHEDKVEGIKKPQKLKKAKAQAAAQAAFQVNVIAAVTRPRRAVTMKLPAPRYMVDPVWGPWDAGTGGTWMKVTIGPLQGGPGFYGSPPAGNTPAIMRDLLDGAYNHFGWIAGHLLNDNLGGLGVAQNLTPLTTAGNKNHLNTCETLIKNFVNACYSRLMNSKSDEYYFGVEYKVVVGDEKWDGDDNLLKHVATRLRVWAQPVKMHKITGDISAATATETGITCHFHPLVGVEVDNTGYDNLV